MHQVSLIRALRQTKNEKAIQSFLNYSMTKKDLVFIQKSARDVLVQTPLKAFHCAAMSAVWAAMIEDHSDIPVAVVTGTLKYKTTTIFLGDRPIQRAEGKTYINEIWDGHCWIEMPGLIGDISLFRTVNNAPLLQDFAQYLSTIFGASAGMICASPITLANYELYYERLYTLSTLQINGLILGAYP